MTVKRLIAAARTPGYRRSVLIRRFVAVCLLAAAVISAVTSRNREPEVVVFARDVAAGAVIAPEDVALRRLPAKAVPDRALTSTSEAEDAILAAGAAAGEIVTTTRLVGPDLTRSLVASGAVEDVTLVPVALAEPDIVPVLHHGAAVSVISVEDTGAPRTIATGARVVVAGQPDETVLLLLPRHAAAEVAAASLSAPLTVVLEATG
ncbi:SAF domain-containing protein [Corynebacterium sp.]|uniref:SAF domain-containing protein n=1 Tax=Corynebacterium sp. TaxID=1720 RepID=UPI002A9208E0|nr:SAF domain-containing protein [Corynebacterium sp.]MDY5784503.1 SAF domain-containing protein [Corynebacterium sp.]